MVSLGLVSGRLRSGRVKLSSLIHIGTPVTVQYSTVQYHSVDYYGSGGPTIMVLQLVHRRSENN